VLTVLSVLKPSSVRRTLVATVVVALFCVLGMAGDSPVHADEVGSTAPAANAAPPLVLSKARLDPLSQSVDYVSDYAPEGESKWIEVDLSEQMVIAHENGVPVRAFVVSTGLPQWPTVQGRFRIWAKTAAQTMSGGSRAAGDYYSLPNVQWVSYFYQDYGLHGAYWHNNFGQPMSHGCVNMTNEDAEWLFFWSGPVWSGENWVRSSADNPGTVVIVHE